VPSSLDGKLLKLMQGLRQKRCLVLDNAETILSAGQTGQYRAGYEGYGQLFKEIGGVPSELLAAHQPRKAQIVPPEGQDVLRTLLRGLNPKPDENSFADKGIFAGTASE